MTLAVNTQGLHPTTESCLEAFQWLHERMSFHNTLDMGCGNGILAVTAASIWNCRVLAVDISEKAIQDTRHMVRSHGLEEQVTVARSDGFANQLIFNNSPYDLLCFNLLAEQIIRSAAQVRQHLAPGGIAVISGILAWQMADTEATYKALGFELIKEINNTPWRTLIYRRQTPV